MCFNERENVASPLLRERPLRLGTSSSSCLQSWSPIFRISDVTDRDCLTLPRRILEFVRGCYFIKENNCGDSDAFCISFTKRMSSFDGEEKSANTLVDRGCIFKCAGGNVDTGLCERCYGKIGIDTDCWDRRSG